MNNVIKLDKKWYTNRDVVKAVKTVETENESLKEVISELISLVQRQTSSMTVIHENVEHLTNLVIEIKDVASIGAETATEIKHTKFIGQTMKLLPTAVERAKEMTNKQIRRIVHKTARVAGGGAKGYNHIYVKLEEATGVSVYDIGKVRLKKSDGIDGWSKDPSYINAILKTEKQVEAAVVCMQILADN